MKPATGTVLREDLMLREGQTSNLSHTAQNQEMMRLQDGAYFGRLMLREGQPSNLRHTAQNQELMKPATGTVLRED